MSDLYTITARAQKGARGLAGMTNQDMKDLLEEHGIEYKKSGKRSELAGLIIENDLPVPETGTDPKASPAKKPAAKGKASPVAKTGGRKPAVPTRAAKAKAFEKILPRFDSADEVPMGNLVWDIREDPHGESGAFLEVGSPLTLAFLKQAEIEKKTREQMIAELADPVTMTPEMVEELSSTTLYPPVKHVQLNFDIKDVDPIEFDGEKVNGKVSDITYADVLEALRQFAEENVDALDGKVIFRGLTPAAKSDEVYTVILETPAQ